METGFLDRKALHPGQRLDLRVQRGMMLVAARGKVHIAGPDPWLAGGMVQQGTDLQEGDAHTLLDDGWISLSSRRGAEVVCVDAPPAGGAVTKLLALLAAVLHRALPANAAGRR